MEDYPLNHQSHKVLRSKPSPGGLERLMGRVNAFPWEDEPQDQIASLSAARGLLRAIAKAPSEVLGALPTPYNRSDGARGGLRPFLIIYNSFPVVT